MSLARKIHLESQLFPKSTDKVVASWIEEANRIDKLLAERDDYEQALLAQRAETIALAQQVTALQAQLAAALATIERACVAPEADTGALYAEGCAP